MKNNRSYIGLFRTFPDGEWEVTFPDLPGCTAQGSSFKEAFREARRSLADYLADIDEPAPRPRSTAELMIDAQRDWLLCRQFVDSVMHPVEPEDGDQDRAPLSLVAMRKGGGDSPGHQPGA